jgi:rRNA maturation RNase YbeY
VPVRFFNADLNYRLSGKLLIKKWIHLVAESKRKTIGDLNIVFCSDRYLLSLNQSYLRHNTLTDIITFDYSEKKSRLISGEIFISIPRVRENAKKFGCPAKEETHRVIIHGVLHLLGFRDKKKEEIKRIRKAESECLVLRPRGIK